MSLKKTYQTKENKLFKLADIAVYVVILVITAVLLITLVFMRDNSSLHASGAVAQISSKGDVIFEFDFGNNGHKILAEEGRIEVTDGDVLTVKVFAEGGNGYNEIAFHTHGGGKITVVSANCSLRHDCTYMSINRAGDSIVCIPHQLIVSIKSAITHPSTGR